MGNPVHLITTVVAAPLVAINRILGGSAHTQDAARALDRQLGLGGGGGFRPLKLLTAPFALPTQLAEIPLEGGPAAQVVSSVNRRVFGVSGLQQGRSNLRPLV